MPALHELAKVIRSKNAKPFYITFDILFDTESAYHTVIRSGVVNVATVAATYRVDPKGVQIMHYAPALAIKVTVDRWVPAGSFGDRDLLGAQQATLLYDIEVTADRSS